MADASLAEILLTAARRDGQAFEKLASDPALHDSLAGFHAQHTNKKSKPKMVNLHDSLAGFHAQQRVEKALKAVLAHRGVVFRRTHDIAELLDLPADNDLAPPHADVLDELNPYAVEMRYGLVDPTGLDRPKTALRVSDVLDWAEHALRVG